MDFNKVILDILSFLLVLVIIFGFIGNFLCFKVFLSTKLNKYPISLYFRTISIFDSIILVEAFLYFLSKNYGFRLIEVNDFFCKFKKYLFIATSPMSSWTNVAVSIDRFTSIAFPNRFQIIHKFRTQIIVISLIVIYNYAFYSLMIWNSALIQIGLRFR